MTNKIHYDSWLHWEITNLCNLNCKYCISQRKLKFKPKPVDVKKVVSVLDKSGRIYKINFTGGGDPFMAPNIKELCIELTKKHFICFNTNLTSPQIKDFIDTINPEKILQFHASTHLEELFDKQLIERFVGNYALIKSKNIKIKTVAVAYPSLLGKVNFYKDFFKERNIPLEFDLFIGEFNGKTYPASYTKEELNIFGIKEDTAKRHIQKNRLCNAGYNVGIVLANGNIYPCSNVYMRLGNIFEEIKFKEGIIRCPSIKCSCPFSQFDTYLYEKAKDIENIKTFKMSPTINSIRRLQLLADYYSTRNM